MSGGDESLSLRRGKEIRVREREREMEEAVERKG